MARILTIKIVRKNWAYGPNIIADDNTITTTLPNFIMLVFYHV